MSASKGSMQETGQNVNQSQLPAFLQTPYNNLVGQIKGTYGGPTPNIYAPTGLSQQYFNTASQPANQNLNTLATNVLGSGNNIIGGLATQAGNVANNNFVSGLAQGVLPGQNNVLGNTAGNILSAPTSGAPQQWTAPGVAQSYMNPYTSNVLQSQLDIANRQYQEQQAQRNQQAIQAGAFGGDRQAIADSVSRNLYNQNINQLVAQANQNAYTTGQQGFLQQQGLNLQGTGLGGQLQALENSYGLAGEQLAGTLGGQAEQLRLAGLGTAGQLQGTQNQYNLGLNQLAGNLYSGQNYYGLGALSGLGGAAGTSQNLQTQQGLLPYQMLGQESSVLGSIPGANNMTQTAYQNVNPWSSVLGLLGNAVQGAAGAATGFGLSKVSSGGLVEHRLREGLLAGLGKRPASRPRRPAYGLAA